MISGMFHMSFKQVDALDDWEFFQLAGAAKFLSDTQAEKTAAELMKMIKHIPLIRVS